jgi:hypothetical protein
MQGTFARSRGAIEEEEGLGAVANVPWNEHLVPENDRETQKRMRHHREKVARWNALDAGQRGRKPRVLPYPETPDKVMPGTPCYRVLVGGTYRFVFVVDLTDVMVRRLVDMGIPAGGAVWDGSARPQSRAYWITPHFIYRNEELVSLHRENWAQYYKYCTRHRAGAFRPKTDFDSRNMTTLAPGPAPALPVPNPIAQGNRYANDSYYVPGEPNTEVTAPPVLDPLFQRPFNNRNNVPFLPAPTPCNTYTIRPYPYNQPSPPFPQQLDPPDIPAVVPAAGGGAAPPAMVPVPPHMLEALPPTYSRSNGGDWILADQNNFEVGIEALRDACVAAEEMDYAFALRVQGLRGSKLTAVWNCTDPEYDVTDRASVLAQFVKMYMEKFYNRVDVGAMGAEVEDVVHEALSMHEEFCKGWVSRHHRTLSAEVTSAGEALLGNFLNTIKTVFPANLGVTIEHISRYLRRHPTYAPEYEHCLYHYMTTLEQMRGNRNASYGSMNTERKWQISAMKRMANMITEHLEAIRVDVQTVDQSALLFDKRFIDWHYISGQLPAHHKEFEGYVNSFSLYRTRAGARGSQFPPWQQMRFRG